MTVVALLEFALHQPLQSGGHKTSYSTKPDNPSLYISPVQRALPRSVSPQRPFISCLRANLRPTWITTPIPLQS
jgi:hypothetical protein